ncbi:MAG TPA: TrkH family potassium uptake protein [Azospirillaceae bacterium]|nr:TrkH family potassium uptake protein [Azospirillaceae bacterium]
MGAIDVRPVLYVIGSMLGIIAIAMLIPMAADLTTGHRDWQAFAVSALVTLFFGVLIMLTNRTPGVRLSLRQTFLLTTLSWIAVCVCAAIPFSFTEVRLSYTDALFEATSGLTSTGATVIAGLDTAPAGILLWRALLNWLGGIGIVALGIAILPFLRVGGMQLFKSESSDKSEKVLPRAADLAFALGWVYLILTLACAALLALAGMPMFDAVCHAMTALATGGFSTRDASIGAYGNPAVEWIVTLFMYLGALPFVRFISFARGDYRAIWQDSQVRRFTYMLLAIGGGLGLWVSATQGVSIPTGLRLAMFNVVSIVTTTGFVTTDYQLWGAPAVSLFFVLMLLGGCTGSTSGGIKMFRLELLALVLRQQVSRLYTPRRVMPLTYNGKPVDTDILLSATAFVFVYLAALLLIGLVLGLMGLDLVTAVTGATMAVGNIGPGLGDIIGPAGNFSSLPDGVKWVLSFGMLLGRLELFTVLVLLSPRFWRA